MITAPAFTLTNGHACYTVTADLDGGGRKVVYVGACPMASLASMPDAQDNSEWQRLVMRSTMLTLTVCGVFPTPGEASGMAAALVIGLAPWINRNGTHSPVHDRSAKRLLCSDGRTFDSSAAAAVALGVTASAISKHLNGRLAAVAGVKLTRMA